ncbi:endolytic transglycosylase MltG [Candidatus Parcubacteria bacterium]|nr:endolytic transglycosylase MltG [Candidatus Parcubacteria bacterium]
MNFFKRYRPWFVLFALILLIGGYMFLLAPPSDFPLGETVSVARGTSVYDIADELSEAHVIQHPSVLWFILRFSGASARVQAGTYLFNIRENVLMVAYRLATGAFGLPPVQITFPEGVTVRDISEKVAEALPLISAQKVVALGASQEGYLFPDTYFFPPDASAESVVKAMRANFDAKIATLTSDIEASGHSLSDIITMASLVEKEARTDNDKRIVAGILWNRLARKMPLQVDAVFGYIYNRDTYSPSLADLTVNSPYNTYTHIGLPPGPICNPGLESILAALHPIKTNYLYYLTDKNGVMHYATTYAAHQANQRKYLH